MPEEVQVMVGERVRFPSGRYVHWSGWPLTICRRVMRWHTPIPTDDPVTCPSCLRIRPDHRVREVGADV